jgi:hypothetical protein
MNEASSAAVGRFYRYDAGMGQGDRRENMRNAMTEAISERRPMRLAAAAVAAAVIIVVAAMYATTARAGLFTPSTGRWCALTTIGLNDCSYDTYAQCMATLSGVGGVCSENLQAPRYEESPPPPPRHRRHSNHHRHRAYQ